MEAEVVPSVSDWNYNYAILHPTAPHHSALIVDGLGFRVKVLLQPAWPASLHVLRVLRLIAAC